MVLANFFVSVFTYCFNFFGCFCGFFFEGGLFDCFFGFFFGGGGWGGGGGVKLSN